MPSPSAQVRPYYENWQLPLQVGLKDKYMPYGLFDYGGTINTMGLSPAYTARIAYTDRIPEEGNQMVTRAIPEEAPPQLNTTMMMGEEGNPYTLRMPEEGPINPPSGGTGGCPAGYAPAQTGGGYPVAPNPYIDKPQIFPGQTYQFYGK